MKVTEVKIYLADKGVIRAIADITLNDCWVIHGLKVIRHSRGYAVAMPHKKWRKGGKYKIAFPITDEARHIIEDAVMAEFWKVSASAEPNNEAPNISRS